MNKFPYPETHRYKILWCPPAGISPLTAAVHLSHFFEQSSQKYGRRFSLPARKARNCFARVHKIREAHFVPPAGIEPTSTP